MIIYIDADACPVKEETLRVAHRHQLRVILVSDGGIRPNPHPLVDVVVVTQGADAADDWIVEEIAPGDICVTGDIPLADRCLKKDARAIRHNGEMFTQSNIGQQLAMRDLMADFRSANPLNQGGGGRPFSKSDRSRFLDVLEREVRKRAP
ncbi:MAG: YaiI/YqxD family protein [Pikeienuella sp.]